MGLKTYIARRIVYMLILMWAVMTVNFLIFDLMPGSPLEQYVSKVSGRMTPEQIEILKEKFGLNKPLHERYLIYLHNLLVWDFGVSHYSGSVSEVMKKRLVSTLELMGISTVITIFTGILLGIVAGYKRGSSIDTALVVGALITYSVPIFWLGWLIQYIFAVQLHWFPAGGKFPEAWMLYGFPNNIFEYIAGRLYHLVLPVVTLVLFSVGGWILLTRACILETITEDYVITARAKGLRERTVLLKHVLKNASLPLITSATLSFAFMIGGAIITETIYNYEGMGRWTWLSILNHDIPALQAIFYVSAIAVIVANFIADLLYGVIDPRIKYG